MNQREAQESQAILVVDDTPANLMLLFEILSKHGYRIHVASNGKRALESAWTDPPDLILLDIMMPDMNGFEVAQALKSNEQTRDIPIIFISALGDVENKVKAFHAGGVDYVNKPFQPEEVLARVDTHLKLRALQKQLAQRVHELEQALSQIKELHGLLPICASCKKIRDDQGYWQEVDVYIRNHSEADFSHTICPECFKKLYPEFADIVDQETRRQNDANPTQGT